MVAAQASSSSREGGRRRKREFMRQSEGLKDKKKTKQKRERGGGGRGSLTREHDLFLPDDLHRKLRGGPAADRQTYFFPAPFSFSLFSPAPKNRLQRREGREKKQGEGQRRGGVLPWSPGRA